MSKLNIMEKKNEFRSTKHKWYGETTTRRNCDNCGQMISLNTFNCERCERAGVPFEKRTVTETSIFTSSITLEHTVISGIILILLGILFFTS